MQHRNKKQIRTQQQIQTQQNQQQIQKKNESKAPQTKMKLSHKRKKK